MLVKGFLNACTESGRYITVFERFFMELNVPTIVWKDRSEISRIRSRQFGALDAYPTKAILRNPMSALSAHKVNFEGNLCPIELQNHDTAWDCKHSMKVLRPFNLGVNRTLSEMPRQILNLLFS